MTTTDETGVARLSFRERARLHRLRRRVRSGEVNEGWFSRREVAFMQLVKAEISDGKLTDQCELNNSTFWAKSAQH